MEKKQNKAAALLQLESSIKNKTTEGIKDVKDIEKEEHIDNSHENKDTPSGLIDLQNIHTGKKNFNDFFESNWKTKNAEKIAIDTEIKNILSRLTVNSECSTMSLATNILKHWIEDNKLNIEKYLREQSKLKF